MDLAASQRGLITLGQARALGIRDHELHYRLATGELVAVHQGVYRYAAASRSWEQELVAACLAMPPLVAVSHRAAVALHRLWSDDEPRVEITVTPDRSPELHGVLVHRIADLSARWITTIDGIVVTSPARSIVDLGLVLPLGSVARVFDRALGRGIVSVAEVRTALRAVARRGRNGVGIARTVVAERSDSKGGSVLERRMSALIRRYGLPVPVPEHTVLDEHGQFIARVDFAYPEVRYAIEVDGFVPHAERHAFEHDRVRQNDLVDRGWTVHRFTAKDIERHPGRVAERIRARYTVLCTLNLSQAG